MKRSRVVAVVGGCSAILGAGWVAAPPSTRGPGWAEPDPASTPSGGEVFEGPVVTNIKGNFQVGIVVADGIVTDVLTLQSGTPVRESADINAMAVPLLEERILEAQTWDVEYVSGASYTSPGFVESARGAFEAAGLG